MKRKMEILGAGVVAAVVIACGDAAMNGAGGMLNDAGEMMSDAGQMMMDAGGEMMRDAGQVMMDAGGAVMRDAGEVVRDAGEIMRDAGGVMRDGSTGMMDSAAAQSCEACTASGRQMVVTADQDIEQLRGGTVERGGWVEQRGAAYTVVAGACDQSAHSRVHSAELVHGPFVLTDFRASAGVQLYTVGASSPCHEVYEQGLFIVDCPNAAQVSGQRFRRPENSRTLLLDPASAFINGARILVPDGEKLCALAGSTTTGVDQPMTTAGQVLVWSGFVPYE